MEIKKNNSGLENSSDNGVNRQANTFKRRQFVKSGTKLKGLIIEILAFCFLKIFEFLQYFFTLMSHSEILKFQRRPVVIYFELLHYVTAVIFFQCFVFQRLKKLTVELSYICPHKISPFFYKLTSEDFIFIRYNS